jgi:hypothetical protein
MIFIFKYHTYLIYLKVGFQAHQQAIDYLEVTKKVILLFCILCNIDKGHFVFTIFVFKYDIFSEFLLKYIGCSGILLLCSFSLGLLAFVG